MLFQMCTKLTFGLSYILVIAVIEQNRIKSVSVSCSFVIGSLDLTIKYAPNLKRLLSNINVVAIQNSLDRFRNIVNVRNNSKTSRWYLLIRSITCCNFIPWIFKLEQGCALAAPGRLRRLTFGLRRLKKKSGRPSGRIDFGLCENSKRNQQTYRNGTERNETKRNSIVLPGSR